MSPRVGEQGDPLKFAAWPAIYLSSGADRAIPNSTGSFRPHAEASSNQKRLHLAHCMHGIAFAYRRTSCGLTNRSVP